ncbi:hypothetical protein Q5485_17285 [Escherichia coli]|nr:hypothetical protein [Escherichia coli]
MKKRIDLEKIIETFLYYTKINTTSVDGSKELPSCKNQYKLAEYVVNQFSDVPEVQTSIKENAIATIHLPANIPDAPWICPYISRHLLSLNPLLACCRRYSRGER